MPLKTILSFRLPMLSLKQIKDLQGWWGCSLTEVIVQSVTQVWVMQYYGNGMAALVEAVRLVFTELYGFGESLQARRDMQLQEHKVQRTCKLASVTFEQISDLQDWWEKKYVQADVLGVAVAVAWLRESGRHGGSELDLTSISVDELKVIFDQMVEVGYSL